MQILRFALPPSAIVGARHGVPLREGRKGFSCARVAVSPWVDRSELIEFVLSKSHNYAILTGLSYTLVQNEGRVSLKS